MIYFPSKKSLEHTLAAVFKESVATRSLLEEYSNELAGKGEHEQAKTLHKLVGQLDELGLVFWDWIDQSNDLLALLNGKMPKVAYQGRYNWEKHALFGGFQTFTSPFLSSALIHLNKELNSQSRSLLLSYCTLLSPDERLFVEQKIIQPIIDLSSASARNCMGIDKESGILEIIEPITSEEILFSINSLSRRSYHLKVEYVDLITQILDAPGCTPRLAYRVLNRLTNLDLNPEHREKIEGLIKDLKKGEVSLGRQKRPLLVFRWAFVLIPVFIAVLVFAVFWIKNYQPPVKTALDSNSSFEQFTPEERRQLDSLIHLKESQFQLEEDDKDQYMWTSGTNVSLTLRQPLQNELMEKIYENWIRDAALFENGINVPCKDTSKILGPFKNVNAISEIQGDHEILMKNESEYLIYLFCWEEYQSGEVFSIVIKPQEKIKFNMLKKQQLLFVAGKSMDKFYKPSNTGLELPDPSFDHHFCSVDANFHLSLTTLYSLERPSSGHNKILISGSTVDPFVVADLYGILETN